MRIVREHKIAQFADKIRADIAAGALPSSTDPDALARYVMALLSGIAQQARDGASRVKLDRLAAVAAGLWP